MPNAAPALSAVVDSAVPDSAVRDSALRDRLLSVAPNRRRLVLQEHVRALAGRVLRVADGEALDVHEPLRQLGLDSLMAVELRNLLGKAVGRPVPAGITFDHPSVSALTDFLAADALADAMGTGAADAPVPAEAGMPNVDAIDLEVAVPDDLSEDELAERLARRLDRLLLEGSQ